MRRKPNIIVCTCDELRAFSLGAYGNTQVKTPNIDRLAGEGLYFENAVSNTPLCVPARSCLISGQHAWTCTGTQKKHRLRHSRQEPDKEHQFHCCGST